MKVFKVRSNKCKKKKKTSYNHHKGFWIIIAIIFVLVCLSTYLFLNFYWGILKKDVYLELGNNSLDIKDIFQGYYIKNSKIETDLKTIDFTKVGKFQIKVKINKHTNKVTLHIVDTTKPKVVFQDVAAYLDYEFKAEDFITEIKDLQPTNVTIENKPDKLDFGEYKVKIVVTDASNNETRAIKKLTIGAIKPVYELELGNKIKKTDLVYNKENSDEISDSEIKKINEMGVGTYTLKTNILNHDYETEIIVKDTVAPKITLKKLTIYNDVKKVEASDFVKKVVDASKVKYEIEGSITYGKVGTYELKIKATDESGNVSEKETTLTIKKDNDAPVIYGTSSLTINKNASVDYLKGVYASDKKDGKVSVKISSNNVNSSSAGTYYVTYVATDKAGNKATKKRQVTVRHDSTDLRNKINSVASQIGSSPSAVLEYVNAHMRNANTWGEDDATWYGLTNWRGNCYVHASVLKALLEAKGYACRLINASDKSHYWVLVNVGGVWRHYDSVSAYKQNGTTDEERLASLHGKDWNHNLWPAAV